MVKKSVYGVVVTRLVGMASRAADNVIAVKIVATVSS